MSALLRRSITALTMMTAAASLAVVAAPASAAASASTPTVSLVQLTANGVNCTNVVQIGTKKVVWDRGMEAFTVRQYKAYEGRNPRTGEAVHVSPKRLPFFKVGKDLRQRVNGEVADGEAPRRREPLKANGSPAPAPAAKVAPRPDGGVNEDVI